MLLGVFILLSKAGLHKDHARVEFTQSHILRVSGLGWVSLVFRGVNVLPFAALNSGPDVRRCFPLARLFIGVQRFSHADIAHRSVRTGEAIQQTAVAVRAIAMAVARLLVQNFLYLRCRCVSVFYHGIIELRWIESPR